MDHDHVPSTNLSDYTAHPTVSFVPGNTMATVIVGNYEYWVEYRLEIVLPTQVPIATISHMVLSLAYTPSWTIQCPNV